MKIDPPREFNLDLCLQYAGRSEDETSFCVQDGSFYSTFRENDKLLMYQAGMEESKLSIRVLGDQTTSAQEQAAVTRAIEVFDLERNLRPFYNQAAQIPLLAPLIHRFYGLRIIRIPGLFEALAWAIIGQQINLAFAYRLKRRLVQQWGQRIEYDGIKLWEFPSPERCLSIEPEQLLKEQFSRQKVRYILALAEEFASGKISKTAILKLSTPDQMRERLVQLLGIGHWTAEYALMRCIGIPSAFPVADVGLHNALKQELNLDRKPTIDEINDLAREWQGWEAYATFYLWRVLY